VPPNGGHGKRREAVVPEARLRSRRAGGTPSKPSCRRHAFEAVLPEARLRRDGRGCGPPGV